MLAYFYWDPNSDIFTIPFIDHPVKWYGFLFVLGFFLGYLLIIPQFLKYITEKDRVESKVIAMRLADRLLCFIIAGTLIGARAFHMFFYDFDHFRSDPLEFFKIWHGGLASHGGVIGILIGIYLFRQTVEYPALTFLRILDIIAVPALLAAAFIRLGNFMNQEIVGTQTSVPWAVIFAHPMDHLPVVPRHPSQLYEALAYFLLFVFLYPLIKKNGPAGKLTGLVMALGFTARFLIEFTKETQNAVIDQSFLQMGQWLSLPFILLGAYLYFRKA